MIGGKQRYSGYRQSGIGKIESCDRCKNEKSYDWSKWVANIVQKIKLLMEQTLGVKRKSLFVEGVYENMSVPSGVDIVRSCTSRTKRVKAERLQEGDEKVWGNADLRGVILDYLRPGLKAYKSCLGAYKRGTVCTLRAYIKQNAISVSEALELVSLAYEEDNSSVYAVLDEYMLGSSIEFREEVEEAIMGKVREAIQTTFTRSKEALDAVPRLTEVLYEGSHISEVYYELTKQTLLELEGNKWRTILWEYERRVERGEMGKRREYETWLYEKELVERVELVHEVLGVDMLDVLVTGVSECKSWECVSCGKKRCVCECKCKKEKCEKLKNLKALEKRYLLEKSQGMYEDEEWYEDKEW